MSRALTAEGSEPVRRRVRFRNLSGQVFGKLSATERLRKNGSTLWRCRCECGRESYPRQTRLLNGTAKSCGKCTVALEPMQQFGNWTLVALVTTRNGRAWECRCSCGNTRFIDTWHLTHVRSRACSKCYLTRSGESPQCRPVRKDPAYNAWRSMWRRCTKKTCREYKCYGAKGVAVCESWRSFSAFLRDIGPRPSPDHSIDRYPNQTGNYEPGNVRWATAKEQQQNRTNNVLLSLNGETLCLSEWARRNGITRSSLRGRLASGWTLERALAVPLRKKLPNGARKREKATSATAEVA